MDNLSAGTPTINKKGGSPMKKNSSIHNTVLFSIAAMFVVASEFITASGSILLWGEPKCPKNLLK